MYLGSTLLPLLSLLLAFQSPQDTLRKHYEAAEAHRRAGNLAAAETEYKAILAEGYSKLGRIFSAQKKYQESAAALEAAALSGADSPEMLVDLSIAYFDLKQYEKALGSARKAVARDSRSASAHHMLGKSLFMLGKFAEATTELETALKLNTSDFDVAYTLGLAHLKQRQFAPARQIYDLTIKFLGDRPQLRIIFGRAYRETGFLPEAIEEFKKAIALDPRFPRAHYYLGLTYLLKDGAAKLGEAAAEFKVELTANPDEYFANYYLGIIYVIERKWEAAITLLEKASRIQPQNPDPYFHLGQAYQGIEKHDRAIEMLRKAIALNPSLGHNDYQVTTAHYRLGQSLIKVGQTEAGEKELQISSELKAKSLKRDKEKSDTYLNAASLNEQNKSSELGAAQGIIAEAKAPNEKTAHELQSGKDYYSKIVASAHNNIGLLRAERADFRVAMEHFSRASEWNPQLEGVNLNLGLAAFKAEAYKDAIPPLEKEVAANRNSLAARHLLGMSYFMVDDYARASELLTQVISYKTDDVGLHYALALSLIKQGKKVMAERVIKQMVAMSGSSPQLHILLGQAYYDRNETAKALEELKAAVALDSKLRLAHYYLGLIHLKAGKFDEAVSEFEAELALNPNDLQAKYHLAFVHLARQEFERGIKLMREVTAAHPAFADAHYELGKALLQLGDIKGAVETLETAARLGPDKAHIRYQLGRALLADGRKAEGEKQLEISRQLKEKERAQSNP
ncbi:MAG TPA: tetratricopeptide repeat protein [Pyrinomonadaceae bacterium]|jgi:tetratricopeptide (TPR) repeat protein